MKRREIDFAIATKFFGWRWVSYVGIPVRGTEGYPNETRVRMFMSRGQQDQPNWMDFVEQYKACNADMTEPLAYDYCSSGSRVVPVPSFTEDWNDIRKLESQIIHWGLWDAYQTILAKRVKTERPWWDASCLVRCRAALALNTNNFTCLFPGVERKAV